MRIGQKIKSRREALKLSQEELAKRLNVTRSAISNWEIDRNYPDVQTLVYLSVELDISLDELMRASKAIDMKKSSIKKRQPFKIYLMIAVMMLVVGSVFVYQKHYAVPNVTYQKSIPPEDGPNTSDIAFLFKKDIKSITFDRKHHLVVKFTLSKGEKSVGHMLDGNILTVMKEKCGPKESQHDYVHQLFIDTYDFDFPDNQLIVHYDEKYLGYKV